MLVRKEFRIFIQVKNVIPQIHQKSTIFFENLNNCSGKKIITIFDVSDELARQNFKLCC